MYKILVVDDDVKFLDSLKDILKEKIKDIEIICVENVRNALKILSESKFDLIILDVQLTDMHGIDFLKVIKTSDRLKNINVIMISAKYVEPVDRINALKLGADAYFSKPIDMEKLCGEIKYYAEKKK